MVSFDLFKGPLFASMECSYFARFNSNTVNRYLPKMILYLPLAES